MKRICGLETELGVIPKNAAPLFLECSEYVVREQTGKDTDKRTHLRNGSQMYLDVGHAEIASAECSNPLDLTRIDQANMRMISELAERHGIHIYRNNHDAHHNCFGCHENYYLSKMPEEKADLLVNRAIERMNAFLITRILYSGAGMFDDSGFLLSPRAKYTKEIIGHASLDPKPIASLRDNEPFSKDGIRLHLTCGDSLMSEFANYLKIGTAWIVVSLVEKRFIPSRLIINDPISFLAKVNREGIAATTIIQGTTYTALEIQKEYLGLAHDFFSKHPSLADPVSKDVMKKWEFILNILEKEPEKLFRYVDWATKLFLYNLASSQEPVDKKQFDLDYHLLSSQGKYYLARRNSLVTTLFSEQELTNASFFPPVDTRASYRTWKLRQLFHLGAKIEHASWTLISYRPSSGELITNDFIDPYACFPESKSKEL